MTGDPTTGHTIHRLGAAELAAYSAHGWTQCSRAGCSHEHRYHTTRRNSVGDQVRERLCEWHGVNFARRHKLALPDRAETGPAPEVLAIVSASGQHFDLCPACRHWLGRTDLAPGACVSGCICKAACHRAEVAA